MHVIVVGGGIGGLTTALALAQQSISSTLIERAPERGKAGAGIQLSPNAMRVLQALGLGEAIRAVAFAPDAAVVRSHANGRVLLQNPLGRAAKARWGAPYLQVHRSDLQMALLEAVEASPHVALRLGCQVTAVDPGGGVDLADGSRVAGDAVIGADGVHSTVRAHLWREAPPRFTGHVAWRGVVDAADLSLASPLTGAEVWTGRRAHFVCYPVRAGALINFVAVTEQRDWTAESWTEPGDPAALRAAFAGWPPVVAVLLAAAPQVWRWGLFDRPPMPRWSKGRATLLGDAAHPMLPFLAQGAAMAIEDSAVLARSLPASEGGDIPAALHRYEIARRARTARVQALSRRNGRLFHLPAPAAEAAFGAAKILDRLTGYSPEARFDWLYGYDAMNGPLP